jgi:hypothetical protein
LDHPPDERFALVARVLARWLVGDVVYATLPILVLAAITVTLGRPFAHFTEIKEWSFATIVFFGVTIRRFVRIKAEIQQRPNSFKLDTGIQLFVVGLVGAVAVLVLVILHEMGVFGNATIRYLGLAQVGFFCAGIFSLLISVCAEELGPRMGVGPPSRAQMLERSYWQITNAAEQFEEAVNTLEHISWDTVTSDGRDGRKFVHLLYLLRGAIERVSNLATMARDKVDET